MTPELEFAYNDHRKLVDRYEAAEYDATSARDKCLRLFYAMVQGQGQGLDMAQIGATELLLAEATARWMEVSRHLKTTILPRN